jgi:hypothetical protein
MRIYKLCILLIVVNILFAISKENHGQADIMDFKWYQKNQWRMPLTNYGTFGYGIGRPGGEWPAGSGNMYIYGAGIWIGALQTPLDTLVTVGYNPSSGASEFAPGCYENAPGGYNNRPFERVYIHPDWPPKRDSFPMSMRDSSETYLRIPLPSGDTLIGYFYPVPQRIISSGDAWTVFNDRDSTLHITPRRPIGIEVYQNIYSWTFARGRDIVFISYTIKNKTNSEIRDMYMGMVCDPDIGNATDDRCGLMLRKYVRNRLGTDSVFVDNVGYAYDNDFDEGWATPPGYVGFDFLQSPYAFTDGIDNNHNGIIDEGPDGIDGLIVGNDTIIRPNGLIDEPAEIEQLGMVSYKMFTLQAGDPVTNYTQYLALSGYNYWESPPVYSPFDSIDPAPADKRFLQATGPFNLKPDSTATITIAVIAAPSNPIGGVGDLYQLALVSSYAQRYYDNGFIAPNVRVIYPNGGEYLSGNVPISYQATNTNPSPLLIDLFYSSDWGIHWNNIATGLSNTGSLNWSSLSVPDGVCYLLEVDAYNNETGGSDISDSIFTIDNPGNSPPYIKILNPTSKDSLSPDSVSGSYTIRWFARDPEFKDSLLIDILCRQIGDTIWQTISLNEPNDRVFNWDTRSLENADFVLKLKTHDETFEYYDSVFVRLRNRVPGGNMTHYQGICNIPNLSVWIHQPESLTSHQYELSFRPPRPTLEYNRVAQYGYDIVDLTTQDTVIREHYFSAFPIQDFSPIVNGFSIEARAGSLPFNFRFDSVKVLSGFYPQESLGIYTPTISYYWWAFRGSRYKLFWSNRPGGGRTLQVLDLDYGIYIPYRPFRNILSYVDSAYGWCFLRFPSSYPPSETLQTGLTRYLYVCGGVIVLNRGYPITILPDSSDEWIVYPCTLRPAVDGNKYRFIPSQGVSEEFCQLPQIQFRSIRPNPFNSKVTFNYFIPQKAIIKLSIYDVSGREVKNLQSGYINKGWYNISWLGDGKTGRKVATGIYFIRVETLGKNIGKKLIFIN